MFPVGKGELKKTHNSVPFKPFPTVSLFQKKFFPMSDINNWFSWRWQLQNSITRLDMLSKMFDLTEAERKAFENGGVNLPSE